MSRELSSHAPNLISVGRVCMVPVVVGLLGSIRQDAAFEAWNQTVCLWAAGLFVLAAVSDILDGFLARRYSGETVFGKLFDPLADKLLTFGALLMLIPLGRMPAWLALIVIARELLVTTLRSIASGEGIVIAASKWGKMKNAFSNSGLTGIILFYPFLGVAWYHAGWVLFLVSVVLAIASGAHYTVFFVRAMRASSFLSSRAP